jgi:hypothetical protein
MHDELLAAFSQWIGEHSNTLTSNQILVELAPVVKQTPKPAQYADFTDSMHRFVGRVTLWSSGECDLEASATEDATDFAGFFEHTVVQSVTDLDRILSQYIQRLRQPGNRD